LVETWYDDKPYLAFVPHSLPPVFAMDKELLLKLSEADRALGELAGFGHTQPTLPNPQLLIGPFIRREAVLSSRIEGTQTGITDLYAYEAGQLSLPGIDSDMPKADAQEVLNYVRALQYGLERINNAPINLELVRKLHGLLMKDAHGRRVSAGKFRTEQNWIGSASIRSATFVPPPVPEMNAALDSLEQYLQAPHDYPPLLRLAFIHYQFEVIHPFADGNGRTGRLLISLLLIHWDLLSQPLLYLSAFFERHRESYFDLLLAVSEEGKWRDWTLFFLEGVTKQAKSAIELVKALQDLQATWHSRLTKMRVSSTVISLSDKLFDSPIITVPEAKQRLGITNYNTARRSVQKLIDAGILQPLSEGYNKLFVAEEILQLLQD